MANTRCYTATKVAEILTVNIDTDKNENEKEG